MRLDGGDQAAARQLVDRAADQARSALGELRELVRGIHPRVLTDLGLAAAVSDLADRCPIPVTVAVDVPDRLPPAVESAAYFAIAEALVNVVRHADAARVSVTGAIDGGRLVVVVDDDGIGGADPGNGTGLVGLADRIEAVDGLLDISSPAGGPTNVRIEVPCSA